MQTSSGMYQCIHGHYIYNDKAVTTARLLAESLSIEIFRFDARHVALIAWDVLSLFDIGGSSNPVISVA